MPYGFLDSWHPSAIPKARLRFASWAGIAALRLLLAEPGWNDPCRVELTWSREWEGPVTRAASAPAALLAAAMLQRREGTAQPQDLH
jgi:hypothetical protein